MKIDLIIPGTPNDAFLSQMAFFRKALDHLGGDMAQARVVAVFGDHSSETIGDRWLPYFKNIDVKWSHEVGADNPDWQAQHFRRYDSMRDDADMVVLCDADTVVLSSLTQLAEEVKNNIKWQLLQHPEELILN